jgi:adenylate cyclase
VWPPPGTSENETRYECTVTGDTVNEAARLSDLAKSSPSGIAASAAVMEVGDGQRSWQPAGRTRLRGTKADTPFHIPSGAR